LVGGNTTAFNKPIVPWAIGDTSASGTGIGFVTNNVNLANNAANTNGIRPLALATEYTTATGTAGVNLKVTASVSPNVTQTYNSMLLSGGFTYTIGSGGAAKTATITSGAVYSTSGANTITGRATDTLAFGAVEAKAFTGSDLTFGSNLVTGTAGLNVSGSGALTENAATGFTGGLFVNSGTLRSGIASAFATQAVTVRAPGTFDLNGFSNSITTLTLESGSSSGAAVTTGGGTLTLGGNVTVNANGSGAVGAAISGGGLLNLGGATRTFTVANGLAANDLDVATTIQVTGAFGITKAGAGTMTLENANTYTGATTINANSGTLIAAADGALGTAAGTTTVGNNSTLAFTTDYATAVAVTISGVGDATNNRAGAIDNISGSNTFGGTITLGAASTIGSTSGTLTLGPTTTVTNAGFAATFNAIGDIVANGVISGTGALIKNGAGTLTLANAGNSYSGATTFNNGTVVVPTIAVGGGNSTLGSAVTAVTLGSAATAATLSYTGSGDTSSRPFTTVAGPGATIRTSGTLTLTGAIVNGGNQLTFDTNTTTGNITTNTGIISSTGRITKVGAGTLTLGGPNWRRGRLSQTERRWASRAASR
jgi:autotransporter-associated beta strand protein